MELLVAPQSYVQEGTEYAALRDTGAQGQCRLGAVAHSHHLGPARQGVQDVTRSSRASSKN